MIRSRLSQDRRHLLKATGLTLTLPMLESVRVEASEAVPAREEGKAKRLICVGSNLGLYRNAFYPGMQHQAPEGLDWSEKAKESRPAKKSAQRASVQNDYAASPLLEVIDHHRKDFTVFSGLDHRAGNGHNNWDNYLCGPVVGSRTVDQMAAEHVGASTRFESIQLCAGDLAQQKMVYARPGVPLPMTNRPSVVYNRLFASGMNRERQREMLTSGKGALDIVREDAKRLQQNVSAQDRQKLDQYFTSLRDLERRMGRQLQHLASPPASIDYELPSYDPMAPTLMLECEQIMFDLMALALETDSTRVATLYIAGLGQVFTLDGQTLRAGYHALSHHGNDPDLIRDLVRVEKEHMRCLDRFLTQLKQKTDADGQPLLDTTLVMFGTGMGDASRHSNRDLPTLVAGGGLRHGSYRSFDPSASGGTLLGDVFVTMLQQLGISTGHFANASRGIEDWA